MENIKKHLNYIGLALAAAAFFVWRIWPQHKLLPPVLAVLGIASIGVYILLNQSQLKEGMKRKSFL